MRFFRDLSIRSKLVVIILLASSVVVLLTSLAFMFFDRISSKEAMVHKLQTLAQVIGTNSVSALDFEDPGAAEETLEGLRAEPHVVAACIYRQDGEVFARYHRQRLNFVPPAAEREDRRFDESHLVVFRPILFQGEKRGTIYLQSDLTELQSRLERSVAIVCIFISGAMLVALAMASLLQRAISRPIQELARAAGTISVGQDYSVRVAQPSRDEVGELIAGFNDMLTQIQRRDRSLRVTRDELHERAEALQHELGERLLAEEARKEAEQELENQRGLSMRSDRLRSLGEMAAGIAHELNQPLVGVRGLAEHTLLGMDRGWDTSPEKLRERLEKIVAQADRMVHIIEHVRRFAREAGKTEVEKVEINEVIEASLEMLGAQFRAHGLGLKAELAAGLPAVTANAYSLEEVVLNLLSNARDAVQAQKEREGDGFAPGVVVRSLLDEEGWVCLEVEDNGTGIPAEIVQRIFDPFFTTKDPDRGTGLGLSISRSIIEEFGGRLELRSEPDQGTKMSISLPAVEQMDGSKMMEYARDGQGI
jgi:C4-dicarboxylate-specific signal transduction histidine kinase